MAEIVFESTGTVKLFKENLQELSSRNKSVLILACDANNFSKEDLDDILQASDASLIGGVFPAVIFNDAKYDKGTVFIGLDDYIEVKTILDISAKDRVNLDSEVEDHLESFEEDVRTMFVFVDGLTTNIGTCIDVLFDNYGLEINYIGGGSGSLSFEQKPSLFTNSGLICDALIYGYSKKASSIGVSHGWKSISGPYEVTKSEATVIKELDYKPAFEVYKSVVDNVSGKAIGEENFFDVAKSFPFGINSISDEKIVRDPIILDGTSLVCVGNVAQGSYVDILQGSNENLIEAARYASNHSKSSMQFKEEFTFFIDCISRVLFLEDKFGNEISAVYEEELPLVGALTFGEIANDGKNYLEFYNKTSVVGRIGNDQ